MSSSSRPAARRSQPFMVLPAREVEHLARDRSQRFRFQVPASWRSPIDQNPHAAEAERQVMAWFARLGCKLPELQRARKFDVAGYVGIPFPSLTLEKTVQTGKYLAMWLLWDDMQVERLENGWRIDADSLLQGRMPEGMTRFDDGWWQLFQEFARTRSRGWLENLCETMVTWNDAAVMEAMAVQDRRAHGVLCDFASQLEVRIATIGMYATVYLLEDTYDFELPGAFHRHPTVGRLKKVAGKIVGIGNDIFSFGKDYAEGQINLLSTLMHETGLPGDEALEELIRMHDQAIAEYDRLAVSIGSFGQEEDLYIARWLQDVRYASLGFSLWESQAPRYTAYKIVSDGLVIEPEFSFVPLSLDEITLG